MLGWHPQASCPSPLFLACCTGQSSYAHHIDTTIGQHVVDQFTFHLHHFLTTRVPPHAPGTSAAAPSLQQLLDFIRSQRMSSEVQVRPPSCFARGQGGRGSAALFSQAQPLLPVGDPAHPMPLHPHSARVPHAPLQARMVVTPWHPPIPAGPHRPLPPPAV